MRILVLSDTHIPRVAQDLPPEIYEEIKKSDMLIHAGDFIEYEVYAGLKKLIKTVAVCGNMDSARLRSELKEKETVEADGAVIGLMHGYGAPANLVDTVSKEFKDVDVVVFGHSHSATNIKKSGVLYFNPGSPTDTIFAKVRSYGILEINDKKIEGRIINL